MDTHILVFGDSIAYGCWDKEGGWVARLRKWVDEKNFATGFRETSEVHNLSISGNTSGQVLNRLTNEAKLRLGTGNKIVVLLAVGMNDSQYVVGEERNKTEVDKFRSNLQELVNQARQFADAVGMIGLTPVEERKVNPLPWNRKYGHRNGDVEKYDLVIQEVSRENNCGYVEVYRTLSRLPMEEVLSDGVHLTSSAHEKVFGLARDYLIGAVGLGKIDSNSKDGQLR